MISVMLESQQGNFKNFILCAVYYNFHNKSYGQSILWTTIVVHDKCMYVATYAVTYDYVTSWF